MHSTRTTGLWLSACTWSVPWRPLRQVDVTKTTSTALRLATMSKRLLTGHEVEDMSEEEQKELGYDIFIHGVVRIKPEGWVYPGLTPALLDRMYNMKFRPDDVIVMTFSKCGTTWMQEIIWTMLHNPKLDNPRANEALWLRSLELSQDMMFDLKYNGGSAPATYEERFREVCPGKNQKDGLLLQLAEAEPSPRIFKSHYPLCLFPKDILDRVKVVYVVRNPKDMVVSMHHFYEMANVIPDQNMPGFEGLCKILMKNQSIFSPFWDHVKEAWQKRHHPNLLFLFYEELKADIMKEMGRINDFLGAGLSQETLEAVARHTSFSAMKSRGEPLKDEFFDMQDESKVRFFRKGITGDWKNHFSPEMQKEFDRWIVDNLTGTDMSLSWALAQ